MKTNIKNLITVINRAARLLGTAFVSILVVTAVAFSQQVPVLQSPADSATKQSTTIELKWLAAAGDSAYHLQIDTSNTLLF